MRNNKIIIMMKSRKRGLRFHGSTGGRGGIGGCCGNHGNSDGGCYFTVVWSTNTHTHTHTLNQVFIKKLQFGHVTCQRLEHQLILFLLIGL